MILDVSNPINSKLFGTMEGESCFVMYLDGSTLYCGRGIFVVYDVSDPSNITKTGSFYSGGLSNFDL